MRCVTKDVSHRVKFVCDADRKVTGQACPSGLRVRHNWSLHEYCKRRVHTQAVSVVVVVTRAM